MTDAPTAEKEETADGGGRLFGRGLIYVLGWSGQLLVSTLISPLLINLLSLSDFGVLASAIALFQLLVVFATFGLDHALEIQRVEDGGDDTKGRGLLATAIVFVFAVLLAFLVTSHWWAPVFGFAGNRQMVYITIAWTAPAAAVFMILAILQAEDRLARFLIVSVVSTVSGQILGLGLVIWVQRSAETYAVGLLAAQWTALLLGLWWTRPRWRGIADTVTTQIALRLGTPIMLAGVSDFVLTAGDRFIIQRLLGPGEVARYQVAFVIGNAVILILAFTNRAWLPRFKKITDVQERWRVVGASRDGLYWLLGWSLLAVTVATPPVLQVITPPDYRPRSLVVIVYLIGVAVFPVAAGAASSRMLITTRRSTPIAWSSAMAVIAKVVVTFLLIDTLGLAGAALGTLAGLSAQTLWLSRAVRAEHGPMPSSRSSLVFAAGTVAAAGASVYLPQSTSWNIARFAFGLLCLIPFYRALRALQRDDVPASPGPTSALLTE